MLFRSDQIWREKAKKAVLKGTVSKFQEEDDTLKRKYENSLEEGELEDDDASCPAKKVASAEPTSSPTPNEGED